MQAYDQIEYSNVALWFNREQIQELVVLIMEQGMNVAWRETTKYFTLSVQTNENRHRLTFKRIGQQYRLRDRHYKIKDNRFEKILHHFIEQVKGHAIITFFTGDQLVVQKIRYGEAERIIKITGSQREIVFEKECSVTMDDVMAALKRTDAEARIPALRMELDSELSVLHEAIKAEDKDLILRTKEKLSHLHQEMLLLEL
ncbi:hypothetical protein [Aneurinibacillus terranovensis]|uniref:hypothetical protein n=1 Tax=Aneurinibacillus terranovensis TaxID=278991 RepID=UPI0003F59D78|nr:hypothetical protein [Aneurinibacillus terranovensis]